MTETYIKGKLYIACLHRNELSKEYYYLLEYQYRNMFKILKEGTNTFEQKRDVCPSYPFADSLILREYNGEQPYEIRAKYPEEFL